LKRTVSGVVASLSVLVAAGNARAADDSAATQVNPSGDHPTPSSLELFGLIGPSLTKGEPVNEQSTTSFRRVGVYGEFGFAYRSSYFLDPFISVGYATLASSDILLADGEYGPGGTAHNHLGFWLISPGITSEIWRIRLRLGIGVAIVKESFSFHSEENTATQTPIAGQVGLGFNCYSTEKFRLDVDARYVLAKGADISFGLLGVTARGDLITFGGGS
jgi:hypothetical protein